MLTHTAGYLDLLRSIDTWFDTTRSNTPTGTVPCTRGCSACCHGPFDLSAADAALVVEAVDSLDPEVARGIRQRARDHLAQAGLLFSAWQAPWDSESIDEETFDQICSEFAQLPCPALDSASGCLIHSSRPATCRMTGLGMRLPSGEILENVCPIQDRFPGYRTLTPSTFDLLSFESEAAWWDALARSDGHVATTVAGALG